MTTLAFLHGVGGSHEAWADQIRFFSTKGYDAHAWDQPGYAGAGTVAPYELPQVTQALRDWLDTLTAEPVVLVGHSMGGFVAQAAWARFPERIRALALCFTSAAFGGTGTDFAKQFIGARLGPLEAGRSMAEIAAVLMPTMAGVKSDPAGLATAERLMGAVPPLTYRNAVTLLTTFDGRAALPTISVPTLLLAGSDDRTAPAASMERMAAKIPGGEYVCLEGCGHLGPMDQPDTFNTALLAFLQRHGL